MTNTTDQPPGSASSPFHVLGLPLRYDLADHDVEHAYLSRAAALHPDRAVSASGQDDDQRAQDATASLNAARAALLDPKLRAEALLAALGGPAPTQDRSLPPGFLAHIMETRQAIEEAVSTADRAQRSAIARQAVDDAREVARAYAGRVLDQFARIGGSREHDFAAFHALRRELNAWQYVDRLIDQMLTLLDDDPGDRPPQRRPQ